MAALANTKQSDTEMVWTLNADISSASSIVATVKPKTGAKVTLPVVASGDKKVVITTSSLAAGTYNLEVTVTIAGKEFTFPDAGYAPFSVNPRL